MEGLCGFMKSDMAVSFATHWQKRLGNIFGCAVLQLTWLSKVISIMDVASFKGMYQYESNPTVSYLSTACHQLA